MPFNLFWVVLWVALTSAIIGLRWRGDKALLFESEVTPYNHNLIIKIGHTE
ncbi:hypothetical protein EDM56_14700 [Brevibacillus fluminis]|uniref:Uncharacterized protein n=1 Tax=Brevibacillus fluminis TaxID=511487 RepID=A0A3M8DHJ1_9BACL|nr:hypothetical protein EDM56_14700 [Brevibacillus fluminis]